MELSRLQKHYPVVADYLTANGSPVCLKVFAEEIRQYETKPADAMLEFSSTSHCGWLLLSLLTAGREMEQFLTELEAREKLWDAVLHEAQVISYG